MWNPSYSINIIIHAYVNIQPWTAGNWVLPLDLSCTQGYPRWRLKPSNLNSILITDTMANCPQINVNWANLKLDTTTIIFLSTCILKSWFHALEAKRERLTMCEAVLWGASLSFFLVFNYCGLNQCLILSQRAFSYRLLQFLVPVKKKCLRKRLNKIAAVFCTSIIRTNKQKSSHLSKFLWIVLKGIFNR